MLVLVILSWATLAAIAVILVRLSRSPGGGFGGTRRHRLRPHR